MAEDPQSSDDRRDRITGRVLIVVAAVMWSTSGLFASAPIFSNWSSEIRGPLLAFWRAAFVSLALLPFVRRPRWSWKMLPMVLLFVLMNVTFLSAMAYTEPAKVVWLQYTAPTWVFLIGVLWLREPARRSEWWMLAFGMLGVGLILANELGGESPIGVIYGLLAGVTFAGVVLSLRRLRDHDAVWLIALNHLVTALVLAPFVLYQGVWPQGQQWSYLAGFGVLQMGIPYVLFARGVQRISGHEASFLVLLEPILVPLWVFVAWHGTNSYEAPRWSTFVGGALILVGLVVRYAGLRGRRELDARK